MDRCGINSGADGGSEPVEDSGPSPVGLWSLCLLFLVMLAILAAFPALLLAQDGPSVTPTVAPPATDDEPPLQAPERIDVQPLARDDQIHQRLENILKATGWFINPEVRVQDGVVFLMGQTETSEFKTWAGDLAHSTQDVAAVVNQIEVMQPSVWDFQPALAGLRQLWRDVLRGFPLVGFSLLVLAIAWGAARLAIGAARAPLRRRLTSHLLINVMERGVGSAVFLVGLYVVFHVAGLTGVALTVMGGTGLLGLVLGIAFRDITENFLASIFLSVQNPFRAGDLVEIAGIIGFVQALTTRATVLMTPDGNHVQIPNATVYKSNIHNYSSNPNRREEFTVGIGYEDPIQVAQEVTLKILAEHPAVLKEPEPWVLVDSLGAATVNLRIYFWLDGSQHSWLKVKSSVIRLVKRALQDAEISMPDEARELLFPSGVPVRLLEPEGMKQTDATLQRSYPPQASEEPASVYTNAEGGLRSEAGEIQEQARHARTPEEGENLLMPPESASR